MTSAQMRHRLPGDWPPNADPINHSENCVNATKNRNNSATVAQNQKPQGTIGMCLVFVKYSFLTLKPNGI